MNCLTITVSELGRSSLIILPYVRVARRVRGYGIEKWNEGCGKGEEMTAIAHEDDEREGIAKQKFSESSEDEKHAAEPDCGADCRLG